jgi:hypothetical protein
MILDAMNITVCRSTQTSPYKLVFGQDPLTRFALLDEMQRLDIMDEEEMPDGLIRELCLRVDDAALDGSIDEDIPEEGALVHEVFEDRDYGNYQACN